MFDLNCFLSKVVYPKLLNVYLKTLRLKVINKPSDSLNFIAVFWHSKMLLGWWLLKNRKPYAIVSKSKDGEILNGVLTNWNYKVARGSSSKGGKEALEEIIDNAGSENVIVVTPDGPRGPVNEIKNGVLIISNKTGLPIIPVRIIYSKKIILKKSWDKFEIPLPFSDCLVIFGNSYNYPAYLDDTELQKLKSKLSKEMDDINETD